MVVENVVVGIHLHLVVVFCGFQCKVSGGDESSSSAFSTNDECGFLSMRSDALSDDDAVVVVLFMSSSSRCSRCSKARCY